MELANSAFNTKSVKPPSINIDINAKKLRGLEQFKSGLADSFNIAEKGLVKNLGKISSFIAGGKELGNSIENHAIHNHKNL